MKRSHLIPLAALLGLLLASLAVGAAPAQALNLDDIIRLKLAGIGEDTILKLVEVEQSAFFLSVQDMIDLKDAGASDWLIRELMDTPGRFGETRRNSAAGDVDYDLLIRHEYEPFDSDDYTVVFDHYYYDPFAYNWYWWPRAYIYYSPFWWSHSGFYYAGHWCRDWWDPWGPCTWHCDWHYGYTHYYGPSRTRSTHRRTWNRGAGAAMVRLDRERSMWERAGIEAPRTARTRTVSQTHLRDPRAADTRTRGTTAGSRSRYDGDAGSRTSARSGAASTARSTYRSGYRDDGSRRATSSRGSIGRSPTTSRDRATAPRSSQSGGGSSHSSGARSGSNSELKPDRDSSSSSPPSTRGSSGRTVGKSKDSGSSRSSTGRSTGSGRAGTRGSDAAAASGSSKSAGGRSR